MSKDVT